MALWLRPNKYENFGGNLTEIWDTSQTKKMRAGDQYVLYITKGPGQFFLVGTFEYLGNLRCRPIHYLQESRWIPRPPVDDWRNLLRESLGEFSGFDIESHGWIGRIASEGLQLTKGDFLKLNALLSENS